MCRVEEWRVRNEKSMKKSHENEVKGKEPGGCRSSASSRGAFSVRKMMLPPLRSSSWRALFVVYTQPR